MILISAGIGLAHYEFQRDAKYGGTLLRITTTIFLFILTVSFQNCAPMGELNSDLQGDSSTHRSLRSFSARFDDSNGVVLSRSFARNSLSTIMFDSLYRFHLSHRFDSNQVQVDVNYVDNGAMEISMDGPDEVTICKQGMIAPDDLDYEIQYSQCMLSKMVLETSSSEDSLSYKLWRILSFTYLEAMDSEHPVYGLISYNGTSYRLEGFDAALICSGSETVGYTCHIEDKLGRL